MNLSSPGLSLAQEVTLIQARGMALSPDLILVAFCYNDPIETDILDKPNIVTSIWSPVDSYRRLLEYRRIQHDVERWYDGQSEVYRRLEGSFAELARVGRAAPVPISVIGVPLLDGRRAEQPHLDTIESLSRKNGLGYIDLFGDLGSRLTSFIDRLYKDGIHYDAGGHEAIAEALAVRLAPLVRAAPQGR